MQGSQQSAPLHLVQNLTVRLVCRINSAPPLGHLGNRECQCCLSTAKPCLFSLRMDTVGLTDLSTLHYLCSYSKQVSEMSPCLGGAQRLMPQRLCCINLYGHCMALTLLTNL